MAAAAAPTLTITGPDGHPQPVSLIPLPPTAAELDFLVSFLPLERDIALVPATPLPSPPEVTAADKKPRSIRETLATIH
ncbi:hypothetical protein F52700_9403 [Fusarium sp. NRRL 52700]|nr:hypothetical protein F52700_9403 [Fusarium sp. NRRL 52700]